MSVDVQPTVSHAPPPPAVSRVLDPLMRLVLRTPISRAIRTLAVVEFSGRRTGRRRRVVVGWHLVDGTPIVLTPAGWRINFADGRAATVRSRGKKADYVGTLETDPHTVAGVINTLLVAGASPRALGLRMPPGHTITADDVVDTHRALIRFAPA
ncbi:MAG: hypothetical protein QOE00_914, partial [Ilumatobacteraceae bacterium]